MMDNSMNNFDFDAAMSASAIPVGVSTSPATVATKAVAPTSTFSEGYIPIPVDDVLKPACNVSRSLSFGDLYSSLVCIDHKSGVTSVYVSTGQSFFASSASYVDGVEDFRVYIPVQSLLKAMSLAGSHIGFSKDDMSLGFWDLYVPNNAVTDSDDLRRHFAQAEADIDFEFKDVKFPFSSLPSDILGLYSAATITLQNSGIVWFSSENKHFVSAEFPYNVALHLTTAKVLRTQKFVGVYLNDDKLLLKADSFIICVPTFKIEPDVFTTSFSIPTFSAYSNCAPVPIGTMMKSSELFSGSVRFRVHNDGVSASISALSDDKVLFSVPLLLGDPTVRFDFTVTADSLSDIQSIIAVGDNMLLSSSGVYVSFKS